MLGAHRRGFLAYGNKRHTVVRTRNAVLLVSILQTATASGADYLTHEAPVPESVVGIGTPIDKIKTFSSDAFVPMSEAAGAMGSSDGVTIAGALYKPGPSASIGAIDHYGHHTFNRFFAEASGDWDIREGLGLRARAAFVDQRGPGAQDLADYRLILNYELPLL